MSNNYVSKIQRNNGEILLIKDSKATNDILSLNDNISSLDSKATSEHNSILNSLSNVSSSLGLLSDQLLSETNLRTLEDKNLQKRIDTTNNSILSLNTATSEIDSTISSNTRSISSLNNKVTDLGGSVNIATDNVSFLSSQTSKLNSNVITIDSNVTSHTSEITSLDSLLNQESEFSSMLYTGIQNVGTAVQQNSADISTNTDDIESIQADVATLKEQNPVCISNSAIANTSLSPVTSGKILYVDGIACNGTFTGFLSSRDAIINLSAGTTTCFMLPSKITINGVSQKVTYPSYKAYFSTQTADSTHTNVCVELQQMTVSIYSSTAVTSALLEFKIPFTFTY